MKSIFLIIFTAFTLFTSQTNAVPLTFENAGRFDGILLKEYDEIFGLAPSIAYNQTVLDNCRHLLSVDEENDKSPKLPNSTKLRIFNLYNDRADQPLDAVGGLLQRLFPRDMVPNQGSKQDPVRKFTPTTIGTLLNYLHTTDKNEYNADTLAEIIDRLQNPGTYTQIENSRENLRPNLLQKRRNNVKFKAIHDFTQLVLGALEAQKKPLSLYPEHLVERALMAFAIRKVTATPDQFTELLHLYGAMPSLLQKDLAEQFKNSDTLTTDAFFPVLNKPFTQEKYTDLKEALEKEEAIEPDARTLFMLLYGTELYDSLLPKEHFYTNVQYVEQNETQKIHSYPNCGEASLLNILNLVLFDFQEKSFRVELLEGLGYASQGLIDFYKAYPSSEDQMTSKAQQQWTNLTSNLQGFHITYKQGGVAEIINGAQSMAGVLRALFPNDTMRAINDNSDLTPLKKAEESFNEFFDMFKTSKDQWHWSVDEAQEGAEHRLTNNVTILIKKEGKNAPLIDSFPYEGNLIKWSLGLGHFDANHTVNPNGKAQEILSDKRLKDFVDGKENLSPLDKWLLSTNENWQDPLTAAFFPDNATSIYEDRDKENQPILSQEQAIKLLQQMLLTPNRHNSGMMSLLNCGILLAQMEPYYPFATNILEQLPRNDTVSIITLLINFVTEENEEMPLPDNIPPRFEKAYNSIIKSLEDSRILMNCLKDTSEKKLFYYFINKLPPETVTEENATALALELMDQDYATPEVWDKYFEVFGQFFLTDTGEFDAHKMRSLRREDYPYNLITALFCHMKLELFEYFDKKNCLDFLSLLEPHTEEHHLNPLESFITLSVRTFDILDNFQKTSELSSEKILSAQQTFDHIFFFPWGGEEEANNSDKEPPCIRAAKLLGYTKEQFLYPTDLHILHHMMFSSHEIVKKRVPLIVKFLGITCEELLASTHNNITPEMLKACGFSEDL